MKFHTAISLIALFLFISTVAVRADGPVLIQYFYTRACESCPLSSQTERTIQTLQEIWSEYGDHIYIMMVDLGTRQGRSIWDSLNLTDLPPVMVITYNAERTVLKEITKGNLEEILDALLGGKPPPAEPTDASAYSLFTAFSLGFFDTFSPCLIAMLSFTLSYTIGKTSRFKEGFFRVMTFGIGFVFAAVLLGAAVAFMILFLPSIQIVLMWIMCIFAILLGLNLLNLLSLPIQTKPLIRKLAVRHAAMYLGIFLLGFIFYFLDPCIAPFAFTMLMMLQNSEFLLPLLMFCLGAIIPFVAIGILAGYVSKLARITYKHRSKIRAVSGLILIIYALYLIIFYLF